MGTIDVASHGGGAGIDIVLHEGLGRYARRSAVGSRLLDRQMVRAWSLQRGPEVGKRLDGYSETEIPISTLRLAVHEVTNAIDRNRKPDALIPTGLRADGAVDSDDATAHVDERP